MYLFQIKHHRSMDFQKTLKTSLPYVWRKKRLLIKLHNPVLRYLIYLFMSIIFKANSAMYIVPAIFVGKLCWMKLLFLIPYTPPSKFLHRGFSSSHKSIRNKWERTPNGWTINSKQPQGPAHDDTTYVISMYIIKTAYEALRRTVNMNKNVFYQMSMNKCLQQIY